MTTLFVFLTGVGHRGTGAVLFLFCACGKGAHNRVSFGLVAFEVLGRDVQPAVEIPKNERCIFGLDTTVTFSVTKWAFKVWLFNFIRALNKSF